MDEAGMQAEDRLKHSENSASENNQYLTFTLNTEEYGIDILRVQEIKGNIPTTRVPGFPPDVAGVLNLRGIVVPIVDRVSEVISIPAIDIQPSPDFGGSMTAENICGIAKISDRLVILLDHSVRSYDLSPLDQAA
jgi:purine-binding chemotaxis protein CheW